MNENNAAAVAAAIELMDEARAMVHGEGMMYRYARRQGFTGDTFVEAAYYLAANGRTFADVMRAAS